MSALKGRHVERSRDISLGAVKLWSDQDRHSADVRSLALAHMAELEARAAELGDMIKTLRTLLRACD
ncbi:MerR family DNA-binding protein, partial [Hymenobacter sp.]|uniref:MerR family DNA-binding protein n=1 Tax=Hymenobacter sp. TaxID=1898978 RepID=UPI0038D4CE0A